MNKLAFSSSFKRTAPRCSLYVAALFCAGGFAIGYHAGNYNGEITMRAKLPPIVIKLPPDCDPPAKVPTWQVGIWPEQKALAKAIEI